MTVDSLKEQVRQQLTTNKLMEVLASDQTVTDADIASYYNKNKAQFFQKGEKRASHILFRATDKALATKVLGQLKAGTISFQDAATKYSTDAASKAKGGDLGWPTSAYVPEFQAALDKLSNGQMSDLVQSTYGYHIIEVTDVRPGSQQPLDKVKEQIKQIILQQRKADSYQTFLDGLRKAAKIQILVADLQASGKQSSAPAAAPATTTP